MLFNSEEFLFAFLPITLLLYFLLVRRSAWLPALWWLVIASLFFYGWWEPAYVFLILSSVLFNYGIGVLLAKAVSRGRPSRKLRLLLASGVIGNLAALGYFKYAHFAASLFVGAFDLRWTLEPIVLPLAISFFTFQQIAFLVDTYRGEARELSFPRYCLFVVFFPQLIAGPIVHHSEMMPQFERAKLFRNVGENLAIGITIFSVGLFKKVVLADNAAPFANAVFSAADAGLSVGCLEAWGGALAYTFQLYFDFSGYSDMAVGLARLFGIRLPMNFNSPYRSTSIIDFWRRWHMTLSRFLRDYLYIPLGGNRLGKARRYVNLVTTMLLGGLWHGAAWTFVAWGGLHAVLLIVNHAWRAARARIGSARRRKQRFGSAAARVLTFLCIVIAWVLFRAQTFAGAWGLLGAMFGVHGLTLSSYFDGRLGGLEGPLKHLGISFDGALIVDIEQWLVGAPLIALLLIIAWFAPNTRQIMWRYEPMLLADKRARDLRESRILQWRFDARSAFVTALVTGVAVISMLVTVASEFLYFNF